VRDERRCGNTAVCVGHRERAKPFNGIRLKLPGSLLNRRWRFTGSTRKRCCDGMYVCRWRQAKCRRYWVRRCFTEKVTSYRVESFEDVVIFLHDVEKCLERLDAEQQHLISRIALQQYSLGETAELMGLKPRTVVRRYGQAVRLPDEGFSKREDARTLEMLSRGGLGYFDVND